MFLIRSIKAICFGGGGGILEPLDELLPPQRAVAWAYLTCNGTAAGLQKGGIWGTHFSWTMRLWRSWSCRWSTGRFFSNSGHWLPSVGLPDHRTVCTSVPCLQIWPSLKSDRTFMSRMINQSRVYHWISRSRFGEEIGLIFYYPTRRCRGCCFGNDPCRLVPHYRRPFFLWCQHGSPLKAPKMCITFAGPSKRLVDVSM